MNDMDKYNEIFKEIFEIDDTELNEDFTFRNVASWDSLTHLSLITMIEDTFGIMFDTDDILNYGSYLNGIDILKKYGVNFEELL